MTPVSTETLELLLGEEELGAARLTALRYAGRRRRTENEIRKKLASLSFPPQAIEVAIAALREAGLVDDRAYIRAFIHDAQLRRPAGSRMIEQRVKGKGIPPEILREEISTVLGPDDEALLAVRCLRPYLARMERSASNGKSFLPGERAAILRRYLTGRGFCRSAVESAVKSALLSAERGG